MNKKVIGVTTIIIMLAALGLVWHAKQSQSNKIVAPKNTAPLRVSFHSWIGNGIYFVAKEKGFFEKEDVKVDMQQVDDAAVSKQLLSTHAVDAILGWTPETIQTLGDAGIPLTIVFATDYSDGADGIIAKADINTLEDLKGKTVAYEPSSPSHFFLSYLLDKNGIDAKSITAINQTAADAGASFVAGKVDAAVTWEPWLSKANQRSGGHVIVSSKNLPILPALPAFDPNVVKERREDVKAFMRAIFGAIEYTKTNPDESYDIIAKGFHLTKQEVVDQIGTFHWLNYADNISYFTSTDKPVYPIIDKAGDLWVKLGIIKKKTTAQSVIDASLLKELFAHDSN